MMNETGKLIVQGMNYVQEEQEIAAADLTEDEKE